MYIAHLCVYVARLLACGHSLMSVFKHYESQAHKLGR